MRHTRAWRNFKRTEDIACLVASLIYLGAILHAWRVLPGPQSLKLLVTLFAPAIFFGLSLWVPLVVGPVKRMLSSYVWMSFRAGFGQSALSILAGIALLAFAAALIYLQVSGVAHGGRYPAGVFSGYGAGIGILIAQALLVRELERDPEVRRFIEQ